MANDDDTQSMLNQAYDATNKQLTTKVVGADSGARGKNRDAQEIWAKVFDSDGTLRVVT